MPFPFAELTMLVMICTLVCLIVFALAYGEMWLGGSVGIAEGGYSAAWKQSPTLARTAFGGASGAPEPSKKERLKEHPTAISGPDAPCEALRQVGFTSTQIDRLLTYRAAYRAGSYQPDPLTPRRLAFARWLYQQGKISG
jgi:hypothetical protein